MLGLPIVIPPTVAILSAGRIRQQVVAVTGVSAVHRVLPLSLIFDHRVVTGGDTIDAVGAVHPNTQSGDQIGLYLRRWRSGSAKATAALGMALALGW
jgi:pyruvate/2-oxoglutarate dehydrogenase complex dihydrolipoamide acyltransferase (E2) component